ncbi:MULTISPECIES: protein kinase domain-containing protein [Pseudofrankia]|uniref:protein kinase domain-containing protein n=1 Tax=Pseudofrankia TaxID=2994363 RepID=UPI000234BFA4|nr:MULTISPECIES: protein kinase [Pseudofrankia]OHV32064.1 hypothetical protein BCD49_30830 [Pseudofrankia sp. EUN1h]
MTIDRTLLAAMLSGYDLGRELGSGAFGLVMAGRHRRLDREVAIKVLRLSSDGARTSFDTEARTLASLDHPHIVQIFDYVEQDDMYALVMEMMAGGPLSRRRSDLSGPAACAVGVSVAQALSYAHSRGILHRDIKASNLLTDPNNRVKVADFGIAKLLTTTGVSRGTFVGTPGYMAPEQITGGRQLPATDLYALAVTLYELLAGYPPFDSDGSDLLRDHLRGTPAAPAGVPGPVAAVIMRALAKTPAERQPSAQAFAADLVVAATRAYGQHWLARSGIVVRLDDPVRVAARVALRDTTSAAAGRNAASRVASSLGAAVPRVTEAGGAGTTEPGGAGLMERGTERAGAASAAMAADRFRPARLVGAVPAPRERISWGDTSGAPAGPGRGDGRPPPASGSVPGPYRPYRPLRPRRPLSLMLVAALLAVAIGGAMLVPRLLGYTEKPPSDSTSTVSPTGATSPTFSPTPTGTPPSPSPTATPTPTPTVTRSSPGPTASQPRPVVAPTDVAATAQDENSIKITWTDRSGTESGFTIDGGSGRQKNVPAHTGTGSVVYVWSGLAAGDTLCVRVRARDSTGASAYSPPERSVCATTPAAPSPPSNVTAVALSTIAIIVSWQDDSDDETGFTVDDGTTTHDVAADRTAFVLADLDRGARYCFRVRAFNKAGVSTYSPADAPVCATTVQDGT